MASIRLGARLKFKLGTRTVVADIVEERGFIGPGAHNLLRARGDDDRHRIALEVPPESIAVVPFMSTDEPPQR
jgi:hypothetical protein